MHWGYPIAFWGLLSLLVPLAIHLLGKRRRPARAVGSIALFGGHSPKKQISLQVRRWALLALRYLLLALVVGGLAQPKFSSPESPELTRLALLTPELEVKGVSGTLDSLRAAGYQLRWAVAGLPAVDESEPPEPANFWQALQDADAETATADTVLVVGEPNINHLGTQKPMLSKYYRPLPTAGATYAELPTRPAINAAIRYTDSLAADTTVWRNLLLATAPLIKRHINIITQPARSTTRPNADMVISLTLPNEIAGSERAWRVQYSNKVERTAWFIPEENVTYFSWRADTLSSNPALTDRLMQAWLAVQPYQLQADNPRAPVHVWQPERVTLAQTTQPAKWSTPAWWWLVVIILFIAERWWSLRTKI